MEKFEKNFEEEDDIRLKAIQNFTDSLYKLKPIDPEMKLREFLLTSYVKFTKNLFSETKQKLSDSKKCPLQAKDTNIPKTTVLNSSQQSHISEKVVNIYLSFTNEALAQFIKTHLDLVSARVKNSKNPIKLCYSKEFSSTYPSIIITTAAERMVPDSIYENLKNEKGDNKKYDMIVLNQINSPAVPSTNFTVKVGVKEFFFQTTVLEYVYKSGTYTWPEKKDMDALLSKVILSNTDL